MSTQIQCQCAPSYGCGQYGCYKLRARASKNLYAVDGETSSSLEAFRRLREYSQEESGRVEPLRELSARPIASDVPSTGDRRHHADVAVSPNEAFLSCCMDRQLPDACLQKCNFHSYTKQALTAMFFKQDACPLEAMREMQYCAAQGRDHRECCIRNGVTNTIAGDKCLVFCDQRPGIVTQLDITYLACFDRLLIPSFNGNDLIFPVDGPLGRNGPNLNETLECTIKDAEFGRCAFQQMTLQDQRFWMSAISSVASNMAGWTLLAEKIRGYQPKGTTMRKCTQSCFGTFQLHPPETNPPDNRGFSIARIRRCGTQRHLNYNKSLQIDQSLSYNFNYRRDAHSSRERPATTSTATLRYINTNLAMQNNDQRSRSSVADNNTQMMQGDQFDVNSALNVEQRFRRADDAAFRWCTPASNDSSTAVMNANRSSDQLKSTPQKQSANNSEPSIQNSRYFSSLASVFGWNKAKAICEKHPNISNVCVLAQLLLEEDEMQRDAAISLTSSSTTSSRTSTDNESSTGSTTNKSEQHHSECTETNTTTTETSSTSSGTSSATPQSQNQSQLLVKVPNQSAGVMNNQESSPDAAFSSSTSSSPSLDFLSLNLSSSAYQINDRLSDVVLCDDYPDLIQL
ncbi:unnamed protein product [Anisakis simplex]|uniref:DB domain-containing protein n=1 Tax=Anisakis simplex TaxID=6269 RepID=A0A0M3K0X3_ANISI|nr:unnamed protein product [Anisakis simplex]